MPRKFRVPAKIVTTIVYLVEADNAEAAMRMVEEEEDEMLLILEDYEGDIVVYYPDIVEVLP